MENFNYTPVVLALIIIVALIYWFAPKPYGARHFFTGPKRQTEDSSDDEVKSNEQQRRKTPFDDTTKRDQEMKSSLLN